MKTDNFYELVKKMRDAQQYYFKTRNRYFLVQSKELEAAVDNELKNHFATLDKQLTIEFGS